MSLKIKQLSDKVIAQIAAGEVIERPLSIVKELVENSIDAKATRVEIKLARGGRNLISVTDNGFGIDRYDLNMALCRHATSKLQGDDIENIAHMGFRGEALASIAAVAKIKIKSRVRSENDIQMHSKDNDDEYGERKHEQAPDILIAKSHIGHNGLQDENCRGWMIESDPDKDCRKVATLPISCNPGTSVEVRDIFCYMPHRLRFLRKESTENSSCIDLVERLAIANPNITFSMKVDDRHVLSYESCLDHPDRVTQILGQETVNNLVKVELSRPHISISGYASIPTASRNRQLCGYCYVNGRMVKDVFFNGVIRAAYSDVLPNGLYPSIVLFLEIPQHLTDVNVHPTKTQVRFAEEQEVRGAVIQAIRNSIRNAGASSTFVNHLVRDHQMQIGSQQGQDIQGIGMDNSNKISATTLSKNVLERRDGRGSFNRNT